MSTGEVELYPPWTEDDLVRVAERFVADFGRGAWWAIMARHGVDTLAGAIERRQDVMRSLLVWGRA